RRILLGHAAASLALRRGFHQTPPRARARDNRKAGRREDEREIFWWVARTTSTWRVNNSPSIACSNNKIFPPSRLPVVSLLDCTEAPRGRVGRPGLWWGGAAQLGGG